MYTYAAPPKEIGAFLLFAGFGLKILPQLSIKVVDNLRTKSLGIILTPRAMFVPISTFLLFVVLMWHGEEFANFQQILAYFCHFPPQILP